MACPEAQILNLDQSPPTKVNYEDLEHVFITRTFLENPERYLKHRYYVLAHGVGLTGEWPYLLHAVDFDKFGYAGAFEPGMTICVESFLGPSDGPVQGLFWPGRSRGQRDRCRVFGGHRHGRSRGGDE